ncbi:MAG: hypothetical protein ACJ75B_19865 [Flavisolibacter sp.]
MKDVLALVLAFFLCVQASAQVRTEKSKSAVRPAQIITTQARAGLSKNDSLVISDIQAQYDQLELNVSTIFEKMLHDLQASILQLNNSILVLSSETKKLEKDAVSLQVKLNFQKSRFDSFVHLIDTINSHFLFALMPQLPALIKSADSLSLLYHQTENVLNSKIDKIGTNNAQVSILQLEIKETQDRIAALLIEKQDVLAKIANQKQKAIQEAIELAYEQSKDISGVIGRVLTYSKMWLVDSMHVIRARYVH